MAIRIRNKFHTAGQRSGATLASVAGLLTWKLAVESIKRLRAVGYDIDIGQPYFDYVCEFMVFLAVCADRIAHRELTPALRLAFTTALAKRLAEIIEENQYLLPQPAAPGVLRQHFLDLFNRRGKDYADFDYTAEGPDFGFRRYFAACLRDVLPEKDRLWVIDRAMDVEAPQALRSLTKTLLGLFQPEAADAEQAAQAITARD